MSVKRVKNVWITNVVHSSFLLAFKIGQTVHILTVIILLHDVQYLVTVYRVNLVNELQNIIVNIFFFIISLT